MQSVKIFRVFLWTVFISLTINLYADEDYIIVEKNNVQHRFVHYDPPTDHFTSVIFKNWENETFAVFEQVKDKESVAIDIGAWIGTTSIWLAKNFKHIISIEADRRSIDCLQKNLHASDCENVSICERPVFQTTEQVIFGPRGDQLNQSISFIKSKSDSANLNDYVVPSITFKQMIFDYVYSNKELNGHKVSFIKCDIEGGEENILEDVLHFAYYNNCKVYMSFHTDWWQSKKIDDFAYLFKFFKASCPGSDVCSFIKYNPFGSVLLEPIPSNEILIKANFPAVIIGYNQPTYIRDMVAQLEQYTKDIIVIDNHSDFEPLLNYYENDFHYTLLKQDHNYGHRVYEQSWVQSLVGEVYVLTDPDLKLNPNLPNDFFQQLFKISKYFNSNKVGFALLIDADDIRTDIKYYGKSIKEWEKQFWAQPLVDPTHLGLELYYAPLDTTFCLINKRGVDLPIRVAGDFTCKHRPWHMGFEKELQEGEYVGYLNNNKSTNWFSVK